MPCNIVFFPILSKEMFIFHLQIKEKFKKQNHLFLGGSITHEILYPKEIGFPHFLFFDKEIFYVPNALKLLK